MKVKLVCIFPFSTSRVHRNRLKSIKKILSNEVELHSLDSRKLISLKENNSNFLSRANQKLKRKFIFYKKLHIAIFQLKIFLFCFFNNINIVFTNSREDFIDINFLLRLKKKGIKLIHHHPDNYDNWDFCIDFAGKYDYFFHFDKEAVNKLRALNYKNIYHIPFGANYEFNLSDVENSFLKHSEDFDCDIAFVGNYYKEREELLKNLTDYKLKIYGPKEWGNSSLNGYYMKKYLRGDSEMLALFRAAKIIINFHEKTTGSGINFRLWEVASIGGFILSDNQKEINDMFSIGDEIETYSSIRELRNKIDFYLSNKDKREEMSIRLMRKVKEEFSDTKFFMKLFMLAKVDTSP